MTFAEEAVRLLGKPPRDDAAAAPEPARKEALALLKRAEAALVKDPREGVRALQTYVEALDLDPACKPAYEAIAKTVLARSEGDRAALEAALRFTLAGLRKLPQDAQLKDLEKKVRAAMPAPAAEPALAAKAKGPSDSTRPQAGYGPGRVCPYCQSPIPVGAPDCRSCSMSGELPKPAGVEDQSRSGTSPLVLVVVLVLVLGAGAAGAWFVLGRAKPDASATKKP